ncbi:MAG: right-handed parallel beta-helix repeat-containing protein, partial [Rhodothermia bacterium]
MWKWIGFIFLLLVSMAATVSTGTEQDTVNETALTIDTAVVDTFKVNSAYDDPDTSHGDGVCSTGFSLPGGPAECTLRAAIEEANADVVATSITIAVDILAPNRGGYPFGHTDSTDVWTIPVNEAVVGPPMGPLPTITRSNVTITGEMQLADSVGTSATDAACGDLIGGTPHRLKVVVDGALLSASGSGIKISAEGTQTLVQGLVLSNFPESCVENYADNLIVDCIYAGTDRAGDARYGNGLYGVAVSGGSGSIVRNSLLSGNGSSGVWIGSAGITRIEGNL